MARRKEIQKSIEVFKKPSEHIRVEKDGSVSVNRKRVVVVLLYSTLMVLWQLIPPIAFIGGVYKKTGEKIKSYVQGLEFWTNFCITKIIIGVCTVVILYEIVLLFREYFSNILENNKKHDK